MDLDLAECIVKEEMKKWLEDDWKFEWMQSSNIFGQCCPGKIIKLSRRLVFLNTQVEVRETVRHEVAHGLAGLRNGHNNLWKKWAIKVGAKPVRCFDLSVQTGKKYVLYCHHCQSVLGQVARRRSNAELSQLHHKRCGVASKGKLRYYENKLEL